MDSTNALEHRIAAVDKILERAYGRPEPPERLAPLDELIYTILSQNTNDTNSERAYTAMRAAFPTWADVMNAPRARLERALRPGGLARTKSGRIQTLLRSIAESGPLDLDALEAMSDADAETWLRGFHGVGWKTARCVLLFSLGRDVFPVDTHVHRVLRRLGILPPRMSAERAHAFLPPLIPAGRSLALHINLIRHGRRICRARDPLCAACPLRDRCPSAQ